LRKVVAKPMASVAIVLAIFAMMPFITLKAHAASTNAIQNPSFESNTYWEARYSTFLGSYAKVQDGTYHLTGSYSGLTKTTTPKQEYCSASLYQSLNIPVLKVRSFSYWIRKGESATSGYYYAQVCIYLSGNSKLYYYHGFDRSSPPPDGASYKYINIGNVKGGFFVEISRNLFHDLLDKFGDSVLTKNITGIELFSYGYMDLFTRRRYGQRVNWEDIYLEINPVRKWTFMVYMSGDNNLDAWCVDLMNQIETVGSSTDIAVLTMLDRDDTGGIMYPPDEPIPQKYEENIYYVTRDEDLNNINSPIMWSDSEVNMGKPDTLVAFVNKSAYWFPAEHYALILMDHGHGFQGVIQDNQPNNYYDVEGDWLEMPELKDALSTLKNNFDISIDLIGFHACLMGQVEVAYQINNLAQVFVASENLEYTDSWPYHWILGNVTANPPTDAEELGTIIVTCYGDYAEAYIYNATEYPYGSDISAIDLSEISNVAISISELGNWLKNNLDTYRSEIDWVREHVKEYYHDNEGLDSVDAYNMTQMFAQKINDTVLQQLCENVQQNITNAIVSHWNRYDAADSHGVSLFFPEQASDYTDEYDAPALEMSATYLWDDFLKVYLGI